MPTFASHVMDNFGGFPCKYGLERYVLVTWITKYKVHQPIRLEMIVGCVVIQRVEMNAMGIAVQI